MKCILILILNIFFANLLFAQKQGQARLDSLLNELSKVKEDSYKINLLNDIGKQCIIMGNLDNAKKYATEGFELSSQKKNKSGLIDAYLNLINLNSSFSRYDEALRACDTALQLCNNIDDKVRMSTVHSLYGKIFISLANFPKAIELATKALEIAEATNDFASKALAYNILGLATKNKKERSGKEYFYKALGLFEKIGMKSSVGNCYNNLGNAYNLEYDYENALECFEKALQIYLEIENPIWAADVNVNIAVVLNAMGQSQKALDRLKVAAIEQQKLSLLREISVTYNCMSDSYFLLKKYNEAKKWSLKSLDISLKADAKYEITTSYYQLFLIDSALGNHKGALDNFISFSDYKDIIFNEGNEREITQIQLNYEHSKQQDSIRLANEKEIAVRDATLAANRKQKYFYVAGIFGLAVIGGLLYNQSRLRKKKNKELDESNKVKARFFSILSHDLRAPIASLSNYIYLLNEEEDVMDSEIKKAHQNKIGTATNNLLSTMEDILLWSKSQMERFEPNKKNIAVANLFDDVQKLIPSDIDIEITFSNPEQLELYTDENYLKTIMRNLTANAIKALKNTKDAKIEWKAFAQNGKKYLSITDNGPGLTTEQKEKLFDESAVISTKTGLGLHLVRDLSKMLQHKMSIESEQGKGTTFVMAFIPN